MIGRHLVGVTLGVLLVFGLTVADVAAEAWFEFERSVEVTAPVDLDLTLTAGKVHITRGDVDHLKIEGVKRIWGREWEEARRVADLIQVDVKRTGGKVAIATNYLPLDKQDQSFPASKPDKGSAYYGKVDFEITAPAFSKITIRGQAAQVELESLECDVLVENGDGYFSGESLTGAVTVRQKSGNIDLASIEGPVDIDNGSGLTYGEFLFGPLTVRQSDGEVSLRWVEGDVRIKTVSSSVSIQQTRGAVDLESDDGDVFVKTELDSPRDFFVQTTSGRILFSVPAGSAGTLTMSSTSGVITTELPVAVQSMTDHQLEGVVGRGGTRIELSSKSGDVTLAAY